MTTRASKITPLDALDMRVKYAEGWTQGRLSRHFKLSIGQVGRIVRNEAWQQFGGIRTSHEQALDLAREQEALKAQPTQETDESQRKLAALLRPKAPSLYDSPPPTLKEDTETEQSAMTRLGLETQASDEAQQKISDELDKLEKGDS